MLKIEKGRACKGGRRAERAGSQVCDSRKSAGKKGASAFAKGGNSRSPVFLARRIQQKRQHLPDKQISKQTLVPVLSAKRASIDSLSLSLRHLQAGNSSASSLRQPPPFPLNILPECGTAAFWITLGEVFNPESFDGSTSCYSPDRSFAGS